jgi:hypothetical protein
VVPGGLVADLEGLIGKSIDVVEEDVLSNDLRKKLLMNLFHYKRQLSILVIY